jgi:predicted lipid-binding transport protein (Tim44 family)
MRRVSWLLVMVAVLGLGFGLASAPDPAFARAGASSGSTGASMGSRGSRTYSAPPATATSPSGASTFQRSLTPATPSAPGTGMAPGMGRGSSFTSGLLGGLIGAGIGGLLFGHGLWGGMHGGGSFIGLLLQLFIIIWLVRWGLRRLFGPRVATPSGPAMMMRGVPEGAMPPAGGGNGGPAVAIVPADYAQFEQTLVGVQEAWSRHDLAALQALVTPEMVGYFAEQLAEQVSRGVRNSVSDVHLLQGNLAESWTEDGRDYATVAMRYALIDVTRDGAGAVVEGDPSRPTEVAEYWTFLRAHGGKWLLSAIQQTR